MEYVTVTARFLFYNGNSRYTVEYSYGTSRWYVFDGARESGALYWEDNTKTKPPEINKSSALVILENYFTSIDK